MEGKELERDGVIEPKTAGNWRSILIPDLGG